MSVRCEMAGQLLITESRLQSLTCNNPVCSRESGEADFFFKEKSLSAWLYQRKMLASSQERVRRSRVDGREDKWGRGWGFSIILCNSQDNIIPAHCLSLESSDCLFLAPLLFPSWSRKGTAANLWSESLVLSTRHPTKHPIHTRKTAREAIPPKANLYNNLKEKQLCKAWQGRFTFHFLVSCSCHSW